jgi:ferredoxin-NADP reductase
MRNRDTAFKRSIHSLPMGSPVLFQGPFANFTLHQDTARPAVFLAGGMCNTPFRSMLWQATTMRSLHRLFLFCANRRREEAVFLQDNSTAQILKKLLPDLDTRLLSRRTGRVLLEFVVPSGGGPSYSTESRIIEWPGSTTRLDRWDLISGIGLR